MSSGKRFDMQGSQVTASTRLCDICLNLDFASICQSRDIFLLGDDEKAKIKEFATLFHQSFRSLRTNSEFCGFCQLVQQRIGLHGNQGDANGSGYDFQLYLASYPFINGLQVVVIDRDNPLIKDLVTGILLCVEEGNPLESAIKGRRIIPSPRSSSVIDQIKGWMHQPSGVQKREEINRSPNQVFLPTRVIQIVDDGQTVKLHITQNTTGQYAALSHCWGSQQPLTLTCANISKFKLGIPAIELPKTFQDAVWLTHQLGIEYIWIDSLCILQDDHDDWVKESGKMCDIYRNSTLTIAATRAAGSSEGFLGERMERKYVSIPFHAKEISGHALAFTLPESAIGRRMAGHFDMEDEPLSSRGWAFQEWCLSGRILHFGTEQIWFEKKPSFFTEDGTIRTTSLYLDWGAGRGLQPTERERKRRSQIWLDMVEAYSKRKLTREEDKLPAIAGLAALLSSESIATQDGDDPQNKYMAGLWANRMLQGLCWERDTIGPDGRRPKKYRCPKWSWASIDGAIKHNFGRMWKPENELAIIQNVHVDLESPHSPFGSVTNAWIQLKATLFPVKLSSKFPDLFICRDDRIFFVHVIWDAESYQPPKEGKTANLVDGETDLFAAPLIWTGASYYSDHLSRVFFIILKREDQDADPSTKSDAFTRVGAADVVWSLGDDGKLFNAGIRDLAMNKWTKGKETGELQEIVLI